MTRSILEFWLLDEFRFLPFRSLLQDVRLIDLIGDGAGLRWVFDLSRLLTNAAWNVLVIRLQWNSAHLLQSLILLLKLLLLFKQLLMANFEMMLSL